MEKEQTDAKRTEKKDKGRNCNVLEEKKKKKENKKKQKNKPATKKKEKKKKKVTVSKFLIQILLYLSVYKLIWVREKKGWL